MPMTIEAPHLLMLLNWMSPAFPTGAFAYSHGLEWAIASGDVTAKDDVQGWIADLLEGGSAWNDAVLFAHCWQGDAAELNALALALAGSGERYLETTQLGRSFAVAASAWTHAPMPPGDIAYPIAAGVACKSMSIPLRHAMLAYQQGFCAALVSVAVRLVPLGQTAGLQVLRDLAPVISAMSLRAADASLDDLGSSTIASDIAAMKHEALQPRVFRT
jgi:urease accessory protein